MSSSIQLDPLPTSDVFELATSSGSLMLAGGQAFEHIQRVAKMFASSDLIPTTFKGNIANCTIALEMAHRMGANPMAVMQNLYIVHGRPGWSAQFIIACLAQCGKFSPLRFRVIGEGDSKTCTAWAKEIDTGETLEGPPVSIAMAKAEGWFGKNGSKWQTMPDLMLRYRAATFFGRLYAPDLLMGMQTAEELSDARLNERATPLFKSTVKAVNVPEGQVVDAAPINEERESLQIRLYQELDKYNLAWEAVATEADSGGLFIDPTAPIEEQTTDGLQDVLNALPAIIAASTKGGLK